MTRLSMQSLILSLGIFAWAAVPTFPQAVQVTARLGTNALPVGGSTTLSVYAQVVPAFRPTADRIFSWYVDVLNTNGAVAVANYAAMARTTSDNDPQTSSKGAPDGAHQRGVYDTFLNLSGAGTSNAVELMRIPITTLAAGRTRFSIRAGTGVPGLSHDFIVAPLGGGDPWTGGDYGQANVDLVVGQPCSIRLAITAVSSNTVRLSFAPCAAARHTVEFLHELNAPQTWQPLAGGPHDSGNVVVTNETRTRFFRLKIE